MLRIAHIFPRKDFFSRKESLEVPVNEFLQRSEQAGWKIRKVLYSISNTTGTFNACLIEYEVPDNKVQEPSEPQMPRHKPQGRAPFRNSRAVEPMTTEGVRHD